jgi:nucleotide-binding universal stress UspA family protein
MTQTPATRRIIAAVDNSVAAVPVITMATALAPLLGASVDAVEVTHNGPGQTALASATRLHVPFRTMHGDELELLCEQCAAPDVVATVIGTRSRPGRHGPAGHLALGLAARLDVPVITVPPDCMPPAELHHVLVATEGTLAKRRTLRRAIELASAVGLRFTVVHVDDEDSIPSFSDQVQHETELYTKEFLARNVPGAPDADIELRIGSPADQVLAVIGSVSPDLVAVGWPHTDDPGRGRVGREILERSPVPVLLVATV